MYAGSGYRINFQYLSIVFCVSYLFYEFFFSVLHIGNVQISNKQTQIFSLSTDDINWMASKILTFSKAFIIFIIDRNYSWQLFLFFCWNISIEIRVKHCELSPWKYTAISMGCKIVLMLLRIDRVSIFQQCIHTHIENLGKHKKGCSNCA